LKGKTPPTKQTKIVKIASTGSLEIASIGSQKIGSTGSQKTVSRRSTKTKQQEEKSPEILSKEAASMLATISIPPRPKGREKEENLHVL